MNDKCSFSIHRNDMFWDKCFMLGDCEFFHVKFSGYNDINWWDNVAPYENTTEVKGDKGNIRKFKIDYNTCIIEEVEE